MIVPFSVTDFIERAAAVYGERPGFIDEPDQPAGSLGTLTYAEAYDLAQRQAARLDELGIDVGDRVAVLSHNSARLLTSFFGVCGSGRVLVPINFRLRPDEIAYIVAHSGARVLYVDPELVESVAGIDVEHRFVLGEDESMFAAPGVEPRAWEPDENATATINYTSGTTARPKGVQLTHRNLWTNAVTFGLPRGRHRPRRLPPHAADVPRQRVGDAVRDDRPGRPAGRAPQGRRCRDPASGRGTTA